MEELLVAGCAILNDDKILLLKNRKKKWYELPGGKVEIYETPKQAAVRELKEEIGIDVDIIRELGINKFVENPFFITYYWYLAKIKKEQFPKIKESDSAIYISMSELENLNLSNNMKNYKLFLNNLKIKKKKINRAVPMLLLP